MTTNSLEQAEAECAAVAKAPRVSLPDIINNIGAIYYATGAEAVSGSSEAVPIMPSLNVLTLCIVVLNNGYTVVGKSAPAAADNFDPTLGRSLAYEDAMRQIWPLMGYELRERLHRESQNVPN